MEISVLGGDLERLQGGTAKPTLYSGAQRAAVCERAGF